MRSSKSFGQTYLTGSNVKRAVAVILGATTIGVIGLELDHTAGVLSDRDTNEGSVGLSISRAKLVTVTVLHGTAVRVATEVGLAVELARSAPAVTLDGKGATITGVVAGRVVIREALVVNGIAVIVDNGESRVVAVCVAAGWARDGREVTA